MVIGVNYTYNGDHFEIYANIRIKKREIRGNNQEGNRKCMTKQVNHGFEKLTLAYENHNLTTKLIYPSKDTNYPGISGD